MCAVVHLLFHIGDHVLMVASWCCTHQINICGLLIKYLHYVEAPAVYHIEVA